MQTLSGRLTMTSAVLAVAIVLMGAAAPATSAPAPGVDARDLLTRMQRMERDIRDLQAETFRRPPGSGPVEALPPPGGGSQQDLGPIMRRMEEFGDSITRLTGQMEELNHQMDLLSQKADRLQKEMDYQAKQAEQAQAAALPPDDSGPPARGSVASLAPNDGSDNGPQGGVLGRIPRGANLPAPGPGPGGNPKAEYDAAMGLLSRGQTVPASEAFRSFVDAHPDDERTPLALFYTGDIAFSFKMDYQEAARNFAELLKKYPMSGRAPEGMLKLGLALLELNQVKEGCTALAALPTRYPNASPAIATRARNERRDNKCR